MKTSTIVLFDIKEPDVFGELQTDLGLSEKTCRRFFQWGEYANIELEVDENLNIVGGQFIPHS